MSRPSPDISNSPAGADDAQSFSPPTSFLRLAALILIVGGATSVAATLLLGQDQPVRAGLQALLAATGLFSIACLRRGWAKAATYVLVCGCWLITTGIAAITGGPSAAILPAYPAIIVFIGWLIGWGAAVVGGVITTVTVFGFAAAENLHYLPPALPTGTFQRAALIGVILGISTAVVAILVRAYQQKSIENLRISRDLARRSRDLERSQAELNKAQAVAKVGSWVYDFATGRLELSAEASRILSLQEGTILNLDSYLERVVPEDRESVRSAWMAGLKGELRENEHRLLIDGAFRLVHQRADFEHGPDGRIRRVVGICQDITESRRAELELQMHRHHLEDLVQSRTAELAAARDAAEAANRAKSVFLANMSHELRTPMNAIMGMTSLALRRAADPKLEDWLQKSLDASQYLLEIINNILDISRIEAERMTLEAHDFSPVQIIDEAVRMEHEAALAKGLKLVSRLDGNLPEQVKGDPLRLRQILLNFIGNAIKFSERGSIVVSARIEASDSMGTMLRFEVSDQGIGISPEQQEKLFRPFSQADDSMTRKYGGTGLGLIISQRIARLMEGNVGVDSEPGRGSTFWATVRLARAKANPQATASTRVPTDSSTLAQKVGGARVLLVEDEPTNREVTKILLETAGLSVDLAADGREALDLAGRSRYDIILMDVQMPMMNGLDATRAIRRLPGMADVPILAMTANAFDEDRERCLAAGMNAHLGKPFKPEALYGAILGQLTNARTSQS